MADQELLDALDRGFAYLAAILDVQEEVGSPEYDKVAKDRMGEHYRYLKGLRPTAPAFAEQYQRLREEATTAPEQHPDSGAFLDETRERAMGMKAQKDQEKIDRAKAVAKQEQAAPRFKEDEEHSPYTDKSIKPHGFELDGALLPHPPHTGSCEEWEQNQRQAVEATVAAEQGEGS